MRGYDQACRRAWNVQISGNLPQHPSYRLLTDRAIRECVTNCARHAHGSTVLVKIDKGANEYSIRITNDGDAPEKNAEEGGGLSALRKAAESEKCIMQVSFSGVKNAAGRKDGSLWYGY